MDVSYFVLLTLLYATTSFLGKYLRFLEGTFLIPASSDLALAVTVLSLLFFHEVNLPFLTASSLLIAFLIWRSKGRQVLYVKAIAYTTVLLALPYLSYDVYEYAQSLLTGFLFVNETMVALTLLTLISSFILFLFRKNLLYSIFDPEFASLKGLRPGVWLGLLSVSSILDGFSLTLSLGFLLAHVVALSASGARGGAKSLALFAIITLALSTFTAMPLACAASAAAVRGLEVLLLRLGGEGALRGLRASGVRKALAEVPGLR